MNNKTYRAAIYRSKGHVDVVDLPYPHCGDDDVIVRNLMAGVCGTDIAAYKHGDPRPVWKNSEFGHEVVSEVVEVGKNVQGLQQGDWVFPNLGNAIRNKQRMSNVGAFSQYLRLPQCEVGTSVIKLDRSIPLKTAVLLEPFMVGARGVVGLQPASKTAVVYGAGIIGMAAAMMLKWYGCEQVMVVDISDFRLQNANRLGLLTCNTDREDLAVKAMEAFGISRGFAGDCCGADLYVDALSLPVAIDSFTSLAKRDAHLAILGVHQEPVLMDLKLVCYNNWHIHGCGNVPNEVICEDVLALMRSGRYDLSSLVTHEYPTDQICDALIMGRNAGEAQKVCINHASGAGLALG